MTINKLDYHIEIENDIISATFTDIINHSPCIEKHIVHIIIKKKRKLHIRINSIYHANEDLNKEILIETSFKKLKEHSRCLNYLAIIGIDILKDEGYLK